MRDFEKERMLGHDLEVIIVYPEFSQGGTWVRGELAGYEIDAMLHSDHAKDLNWEVRSSKIYELAVRRLSDRHVAFDWNCGAVVRAEDGRAKAIVDFVTTG